MNNEMIIAVVVCQFELQIMLNYGVGRMQSFMRRFYEKNCLPSPVQWKSFKPYVYMNDMNPGRIVNTAIVIQSKDETNVLFRSCFIYNIIPYI